jgi:hypothetical protein
MARQTSSWQGELKELSEVRRKAEASEALDIRQLFVAQAWFQGYPALRR